MKSIATLAVTQFDIPGDTRYPLNSFMGKPTRQEAGMIIEPCSCFAYLSIVSIIILYNYTQTYVP